MRAFAWLGLPALVLFGTASLARAEEAKIVDPPKADSKIPPKDGPRSKLLDDIDPAKDAAALEKMGDKPSAKKDTSLMGSSSVVFSDDWWRHTRPIIEFHGFFRTRAELFHNFSLGRTDSATSSTRLFPRPADDSWSDPSGKATALNGCGPTDNPVNGASAANPSSDDCTNKTHASANMRFRVDPEIHISDNLRILAQIDFLDNVVMGSTPEGYVNTPSADGGYKSEGRSGYVPLKSFSTSQAPPTAGVNSLQNSVVVKRVWGEFTTPVGQIRFGRMANHWGLGILVNGGDRIDSDYQSHADRIMFVTGIKKYDLYIAGSWDFPSSGRTSASPFDQQGQPYNVSQLENTNQWVLAIMRRMRPDDIASRLARGETVINGGLWSVYRQQLFGNESTSNSLTASAETYQSKLVRLGAKAFIFDGWFQILTKRLRWETEAVYIHGSIENPEGVATGNYEKLDYKIRQFGAATELEYRAFGDDLKLFFYSGFASGDQGVEGLSPGNAGLQSRNTASGDRTVSTYRFAPDYRIDLILFRNILSRVQGAYYFKPGIEYDFSKTPDGERFGGRAELIYSRASKFVQTPGHSADLGVELDLTLYYQSKDGSLNDNPGKVGGFYAMLQYGVLFPLGGLGYGSAEVNTPTLSSAQILRLFMGIAY